MGENREERHCNRNRKNNTNIDYETASGLRRPCHMLGLSADGHPWWNDLGNCPNYGSSSCPITMGEDADCDYDLEDLRDILSYRFR